MTKPLSASPEPFISVVVCVYNEADNIRPLILEIDDAMRGFSYEIVYVNDGSTDRTLQELISLTHKHLIVVDLQRNYGQSQALAAGIEVARGQFIVTLDGDLQNDPADIPSLLALAQKGEYDMVATVRLNRKDPFVSRKLPSYLANRLIRRLVGVPLKDYGSTLKLFRAGLAKKLPLYGELHRFIPVLASIEGARMTEMIVKHRARVAGTSNYTMSRTVKVISDLVLVFFLKKYLIKPMHFFGKIAVWMILMGLGIGGTMGVRWWSHPEMTLGSLPMLSAIFLLAGIHFMGMGIIAELVMRNLHESRGKKPYTIRRMYFPKTQLK